MTLDKSPPDSHESDTESLNDDTVPMTESKSVLAKSEEELKLNDTYEKAVDYKQYNLCVRLRIDHPFRRRFLHSIWLFWSFVGLGWMVGQTGPSLPDLQLIVDKELDTAAWLFTTFSIGYLVGSFFGGILYDKFNKISVLLIMLSVVTMAVSTALLPWCESFPLMLTVRFISGLGAGGLDTGGNADMVGLWDEEGRPFMQAMHFCFGFGGIISPLVTEPFLARKSCVPNIDSNTTESLLNTTMTTLFENITITGPDMTTIGCTEEYEDTRVHYAYMISFILILSGAIPFFVMFVKTACQKKNHEMAAEKVNQERPDKLSFGLKIVFCLLLSALMGMYCAVEDTFSGFLATFCIQHFKWSKSTSSFATSTHWGAFSVGRFSGIFLIMRFNPVQLIGTSCVSLIAAFIGLLIASVTMTESIVWVFVAFAGFSMSVIFGCIFTWTEESILKVSGKISAMLLIATSLGLMVNPLFLGFLMDHYTPLWFVILLLGESCLCLTLFLVIWILVKTYVKVLPKTTEMEVADPCGEEMQALT